MRNETKYYIDHSLYTILLLFITGGVSQTFFAHMGLSPSQISLISSFLNIAQIAIMIFNIFVSDMIKNLKKTISILRLTPILYFGPFLYFCFREAPSTNVFFYCAVIVSCAFNLFLGFYNVLSYRFIYHIIDIKDYAKLSNIGLIISSILTLLASAAISYCSSVFDFKYVIITGFSISIVFSVIASLINNSMVIKNHNDTTQTNKFEFSRLLKREFTYFYFPNLMRGCANGIMSVISVICIKNITDSPAVLSTLVAVYYVASIIGSLIYEAIRKKIKTGTIYALSSILMLLFLPFSLIGNNTTVFFIFYTLAAIFYLIIANSCSIYFSEIIHYNDIGSYTAIRLITMTLGQAISSFLVALLIDRIPSVYILILCGVCQLISGLMFYFYKPKQK